MCLGGHLCHKFPWSVRHAGKWSVSLTGCSPCGCIELDITEQRTLFPLFLGSLGTQIVKNLLAMQETWVWSPGWEDPLEKGMAPYSSILAWRIPWTEKPGGLQSMGSQRVRHDWRSNTPWICLVNRHLRFNESKTEFITEVLLLRLAFFHTPPLVPALLSIQFPLPEICKSSVILLSSFNYSSWSRSLCSAGFTLNYFSSPCCLFAWLRLYHVLV